MAKMRIIHSTPEQVERRKRDIAARCIRAEVIGALPIRDAVTREDVEEGGIVHLDPTSTLIDALVEAGNIRVLDADTPEG